VLPFEDFLGLQHFQAASAGADLGRDRPGLGDDSLAAL